MSVRRVHAPVSSTADDSAFTLLSLSWPLPAAAPFASGDALGSNVWMGTVFLAASCATMLLRAACALGGVAPSAAEVAICDEGGEEDRKGIRNKQSQGVCVMGGPSL